MIGYFNKTLITSYLTLLSGVMGVLCAFDHHPRYAVVFLMLCGIIDALGKYLFADKELPFNKAHFKLNLKSFTEFIAYVMLPVSIGYALELKNLLSFILMFIFITVGIVKISYVNSIYTVRLINKSGNDYHIGLPMAYNALIFPLAYSLAYFTGKPIITYTVFLIITAIISLPKIKIPKANSIAKIVFAVIGLAEFILLLNADI